MNEERRGASNKSWRRIFKKKWFYPALYLTLAAVLLTAVVWYQSLDNQLKDVIDDPNKEPGTEDVQGKQPGDDARPVTEQQEIIKMPVVDQERAEIVTKFYDYNASEADQKRGVTQSGSTYSQSRGIDIIHVDEKEFNAKASLSGTVEEVKNSPLLGNIVIMKHPNEVTTYYASLGEVAVDVGDKVKQGETIGTAGRSLAGKDIGTHFHFQIRKDDQPVNPEAYFNQSVSKLDEIGKDKPDDPGDESDENSDENSDGDSDDDSDGDTESEQKKLQ